MAWRDSTARKGGPVVTYLLGQVTARSPNKVGRSRVSNFDRQRKGGEEKTVPTSEESKKR